MRFRYLLIGLIITFSILLIVYFASSIGVTEKQFTISVGSNSLKKLSNSEFAQNFISLSYDDSFSSPTTNLSFKGINNLTNISYLDIPSDVGEFEGEHNGNNYLAYTFYLKNMGNEADVIESIEITSVSRFIDEAIRVGIYRNGVYHQYAKANENGESEYNSINFKDDTIVYEDVNHLIEEEIVRYTIIIWLEGDDPDCTNRLYGGKIRFKMNFYIDDNN